MKHCKEKFDAFHAKNPNVLAVFVKHARKLHADGHIRFSAAGIRERMRWDEEKVSFHNDFTPHYARKAMETCPDLDGFFEIRGKL